MIRSDRRPGAVPVCATQRRRPAGGVVALTLVLVASGIGAAEVQAQVLRGEVLDVANARPVAAALVTVRDTAGAVVVRVPAGSDGRFVLLDVPHGELTIEVEALGYTVSAGRRISWSGASKFLRIELRPAPLEIGGLDVAVRAQEPFLRRIGFYDRERAGRGYFVSPEDIARLRPTRPSDLLRRLATIQLIGGVEPTIARGGIGFNQRLDCVPLIYVDGTVVRSRTRLSGIRSPDAFDHIVPPAEVIEAVEVYPGGASVPLRYGGSNSACGVILVWTKH